MTIAVPAPPRRRSVSVLLAGIILSVAAPAGEVPLLASKTALETDAKINWHKAKLIAVQDANRYKTLDSFAREHMTEMYGAESFPGLSPMATLFEWLFNRDAYADSPVVRIKDQGLRIDFTTRMAEDKRQRILKTGRMTPRELADPTVQHLIDELAPKTTMSRAINRVRDAQFVAHMLERGLCIVPQPGGSDDATWHTPQDVLANISPEMLAQIGVAPESARNLGAPIRGLSSKQALDILVAWSGLRAEWLQGDAAGVQKSVDRLADLLPSIAAEGVYPSESQRLAEAHYYALGKFTWGWMLYFAGMIVSVWALVTRWRVSWIIALVFVLAAMAFHAYGVSLRWYILGRIPIANMFEAVVGSAWMGIAVAVLLELIFRTRILLLAASATGFLALVLGGYVIPGAGTLTSIMGILDDVMLRIHTVAIIWSYALVFLAAVIAIVYLIGYYINHFSGGQALQGMPIVPAFSTGLVSGGGGDLKRQRPIMAGAMPGDEAKTATLPVWLQHVDWCHLIILNLVFVMLFVGTMLGAVWADYSWGRPWGWDPKEVFALNTWIVYAILIHVRFFVVNKGLWTAWLSIGGCLMMAFNWAFVNFFIVGLHSYA